MKNLNKYFGLFAVSMLMTVNVGWGQVSGDFRSLGNGNWATNTTWQRYNGSSWDNSGSGSNNPGKVPGITDGTTGAAVTILNLHTITMNTSPTIGSLTVGGGTTGVLNYEVTATVRALTVSGNVSVLSGGQFIQPSQPGVIHTLTIGGSLSVAGTLEFNRGSLSLTNHHNTTFNSASSNVTISGSGTISFCKLTIDLGSQSVEISSSSTVSTTIYGLTMTQGKWVQNSGTTTTSGNVTIATTAELSVGGGTYNANGGSITCSGKVTITSGTLNIGWAAGQELRLDNASSNFNMSGGSVNIAGRFNHGQSNAASTITISGGTMTLCTVGNADISRSNFEIGTNAVLSMTNGTIVFERANSGATSGRECTVSAGTFSGGTIQIGNGSTPASTVININSAVALNNLTVNSSDATAKLITNNLSLNGGLTVSSGTFNANSLNLSLKSDWSNSGTFTNTGSTVTFNGTLAQSISKSGGESFNNLTISNPTSGVTLLSNISVAGVLGLSGGTLTSTSTNLLTLGNSATITGGSSSSYVIGPLAKNTNSITAFTFHVGKGSSYLPIGITPSSTGQTTFTAEYYNSAYSNTTTFGSGIAAVSVNGYHELTRSTGGTPSDATLKIYWNANSGVSTLFLSDLRVAHWTDAFWESLGKRNVTGDASGGSLETFLAVASFGPFVLGSSTTNNPLPVELSSFTGNSVGRNITLKWSTAKETNNLGFEIQRIKIDQPDNWSRVGYIEGRGNTTNLTNYTYTDKMLLTGKYKYRLKQIDINGNFNYFSLNSIIEIGVPNKFDVSQNYPNPFNPTTKINFDLPADSKVTLVIYDVTGRQVTKLLNNELHLKKQN